MYKHGRYKICLTALLLLIVGAGCGDPDKHAGTAPGLTPPVVISVAPVSGATNGCFNSTVTATFGEAMNPSTINATTFTVAGPGTTPVTGSVAYDQPSKTAIFSPTSSLADGTTYTATIGTGARDLYGNALVSSFQWTFATASNGCHPAPVVIAVSPPNASTGLCSNRIISATFSEPMNPSTVNDMTFELTGPGAGPVTGQVTYDAPSNTAIFTPSNSLALNTVYAATITTGAQDLFGNSLAADFVWGFTTAVTLCQPPPPPIAVTPPNGSTGVCSNTVVAATFSQAMDPASITDKTFTLTGPGTSPVTGVVSHDAGSRIFTFTPTTPLALSTAYTATITTAAKDQLGNALASNVVWSFTTAAASCATPPPPAVILVSPVANSLAVCPNAIVAATFNEAMNPATINSATFMLAPAVPGSVTLDGTGRIATFTPSTSLALNTSYTATITTGAQDVAGNTLASNYIWNFTTASLACQLPVPLGSAANFEILAGSTVTNTGPTMISGGNLGLSPGSAVTGFPPGTLVGPAVMHITDPIAAQAELDLTVAYNAAAGLPGGAVLPGDLKGLTLAPGLYKNSSTVMLSGGSVTLDALGDANAVFVFQIGSTLTTLGSTQVILAGGAQAKNIYWQVGSSATLGTNSIFKGTILSLQSITLDTGANLQGRALARNGAVTLDSNTVTAP